ncbi:MAG: hypothetical protein AAF747_05730 [Planctomycetota bacterium]
MRDTTTTPESAAAAVRSDTHATALADGRPSNVKLVIGARTGRVVFPFDRRDMRASEWVLWQPEERHGATQLLLGDVREPNDADQPALMRWSAYHGDPVSGSGSAGWVSAVIESVRIGSDIFDGEELPIVNTLAADESAICRSLNERSEHVGDAIARLAGKRPASPVVVGADQFGVDVRGRFTVSRLAFDRPANDADDAAVLIEAMLAGTGDDG